ncbi:MAG: FAD-dependent oxidoreductase [Solirubrobacteraceae bacterium]
MTDREPFKVLVAGGGIAGLETVMALSDLGGDRVEVTLAAPEPDFVYKPLIVEEPFTLTPADRLDLASLAGELGAHLVKQGLARVNPHEHTAELASGDELAYDAAVICVGARARPAFRGATTLLVSGDPLPIDELLRAAADDGSRRIAFVVPPGVAWALPIYELALMATRRARDLRLDVRCLVVTPESAPLVMFGPRVSDAVADLLRVRDIEVRPATWASETGDGDLVLRPGGARLEAGAVVALPVLEGRAIAGLPADEKDFLPIDQHSRVKGAEDIYAAGDGTNFPIKQGGLGTQQADAAAEHIAARAGAPLTAKPFHPVLRGQIITGGESLNLRADIAGGAGEGIASDDYLWWPPHKVAGRYLAPWLAGQAPHADLEPPSVPLDVEVALPHEWHAQPMAIDPYERLDLP